MKRWWQGLSTRDRGALTLLVAFVVLVLAWALLWRPLAQSRASLASQVTRAEADLAFMQGAASELKRQRALGSLTPLDRAGKSLLALADASARESGLGATLKRVEPVAEGRVNLWFEGVPFDSLVGWMEQLETRYGIRADEFSADRAATAGTVNARVGLAESPIAP